MINKIEIDDVEVVQLVGLLYDEMKHMNYTKPNSIFQVDTDHVINVMETIMYDNFNRCYRTNYI